MNVAVIGSNGRLGSCICEELAKNNLVIPIDLLASIKNINCVDKQKIDIIIDVSNANNSIKTMEYCLNHKIPLVIGATGHTKDQFEKIQIGAVQIPIFLSYNFSKSVYLLKKTVEEMSKLSDAKIYITERHHINKKDSPSGTAKDLFEIVNKKSKVEEIFSMRGGENFGYHEVVFMFDSEEIKVSHQVFSIKPFAQGAVKAIEFIVHQKNGLYSIKDIFEK